MILLTGATGFLGSNLLKRLLDAGYQLCCIRRSTSDCTRINKYMDACIWYDIDKLDIDYIFCNHPINVVIHCATDYGRDGSECIKVYQSNLSFPLILLDCAQRHGCQLFINTDSFFTRQASNLWREGREPYMATYTKSKYLFICVVKEEIEKRGVPFINMQLEHVYGLGDRKDKFVSFLLENLLRNTKRLELTSGSQMRDFIYVEDVLDAYLEVLKNIKKFNDSKFYQFEVGTGNAVSLRRFAEKAKELTGSVTELAFGQKPDARNEVVYSCANNGALMELGWKPQFDIANGLKKLIKGYTVHDSFKE